MRRFILLLAVLSLLALAGCSSYFAGTRYDQPAKQNVQYLRNTIVKKDTRGTFYLSVRYVSTEDSDTIYLVIEHVGRELLYIREKESLIIRGQSVNVRLSQDKKRRTREQRKSDVREVSFVPITGDDYLKVVTSRETTATLITAKQLVRFALPTALKVNMRRFYQEQIAP
jgi:hypothetical protein